MSALDRQLAEDRIMRDAALRLVKADLELVRNDLSARSAGGRVADRLGDAALDTVDDAVDYATQHKGLLAGAVATLALFLFRGPLLDALSALSDENE